MSANPEVIEAPTESLVENVSEPNDEIVYWRKVRSTALARLHVGGPMERRLAEDALVEASRRLGSLAPQPRVLSFASSGLGVVRASGPRYPDLAADSEKHPATNWSHYRVPRTTEQAFGIGVRNIQLDHDHPPHWPLGNRAVAVGVAILSALLFYMLVTGRLGAPL